MQLSYNEGQYSQQETIHYLIKTPLPGMVISFWVAGQWDPIQSPQTMQAIALQNSMVRRPCCWKYQILASYIEYGEIQLVLNWKLHPSWLALTGLEGATHITRGERYPSISPHYDPCKQDTPTGATTAQLVNEVTNHFLTQLHRMEFIPDPANLAKDLWIDRSWPQGRT